MLRVSLPSSRVNKQLTFPDDLVPVEFFSPLQMRGDAGLQMPHLRQDHLLPAPVTVSPDEAGPRQGLVARGRADLLLGLSKDHQDAR